MKKYLQSFRLFFGNCQTRSMLIYAAVIVGFTLLCGIAEALPLNGLLSGFAQGVSSMMGATSAVFGLIFLNALYQYLSPTTPGYKYYRSLPDGAVHFRRAVIAANILGILSGLVLLAVVSGICAIVGIDSGLMFFGIALLLLTTGVCNLTGFIRNNTARVLCLMGTLMLFGFLAGFFGFFGDQAEEDGMTSLQYLLENKGMTLTVCGVSAAVFAVGIIYALTVAEKKWGESR